MNKEEFKIIAEKYANNQCNDQERAIVETFFDEMQKKEPATKVLLSNLKGEKMYKAIYAQTFKTSRKKIRIRIMQVAAIAILFLGISFLMKQIFTPSEVILITNNEQKKEIVLQDGSIVVLNKNSTLSYPQEFGNTRNVVLKGEAYFKVKRNPRKPFIVKMHHMTLEVLGTSFNINSYLNNSTKVSVLTGIVSLKANSGESVILTKNQQAEFQSGLGFNITYEPSRESIDWTETTIVLKEKTLEEIAEILNQKYNVIIDFEDKELGRLVVSGKFRDEKLENILTSIAFVKKLKIEYLTPKHIIIRRDKNDVK